MLTKNPAPVINVGLLYPSPASFTVCDRVHRCLCIATAQRKEKEPTRANIN